MVWIVGLHLKNAKLDPRLAESLIPMLVSMSSRGRDSAGAALDDGDAMEVVKDVGRPEIGDNPSLMLRVPDAGRVEHRGVDGSANPYLASAVLLAAGLDGIDRGLDPGEQATDDMYALGAEEVARRASSTSPRPRTRALDELVAEQRLHRLHGDLERLWVDRDLGQGAVVERVCHTSSVSSRG